MTDCKKFEEQIFDFVEESLPKDTRDRYKEHISNCKRCAELFDQTKALKFHLKKLTFVKTSPEFDTVLRTRIKMERSLRRESVFGPSFRVPIYVATGALAVLAVLFLLNTSGYFNNQADTLPRNMATSFTAGTDADRSRQVKFPMDRMPVGGTTLESQSFGGQSSALADSNRSEFRDRIQTVEF